LAVGDFCRFHQNSLDKNLFEVEITRPITLWSRWRRGRRRKKTTKNAATAAAHAVAYYESY
jgi:hypothetical protein